VGHPGSFFLMGDVFRFVALHSSVNLMISGLAEVPSYSGCLGCTWHMSGLAWHLVEVC
jgi:hypothetical protein